MAIAHGNTIPQEILDILSDAGVDYIFGVPGGGSVYIFTEMFGRKTPEPVLVRNEHTAAIMADAYARATGRPAAILGQGAFIAANGSFGMMEALTSSSPMIVLADTSDQGMSPHPTGQVTTGEYGSPDLPAMLKAITKYTTYATTGKELVLGTQLAIKHALSGCPGPAAVVMRSKALLDNLDDAAPPKFYRGSGYLVTENSAPDSATIERAISHLNAAERPVIFAGKGVHNAFAHSELREVAERWGATVVTTYKGKSAIEETHPLAAGMAGTYGRAVANQLLRAADVVLIVGAKLASGDMAGESLLDPRAQTLIHIDIEPKHIGWVVPADEALVGDAKVVLRSLLQGAGAATSSSASTRTRTEQEILRLRSDDPVDQDELANIDSSPVEPQRLVRLLQQHLLPESNISLDAGFNRMWMGLFYISQRANTFFAPGGMAGMGWALPAALAIKLARPSEPSVAVTGDGGVMMSIFALATAVEANIPVVCVVMNDSQLGMVTHHQGDRVVASRFGDTDYAAIARGFGAQGVRISDSRDLPTAITEAQASGRPTLIDVVINASTSPDIFRARARAVTET